MSKWLFWLLTLLSAGQGAPNTAGKVDQVPLVSPSASVASDAREVTANFAIIGSGIAGSAAAFHLNHYAVYGGRFNITVFEQEPEPGGQIKTGSVFYPAQTVELGAATFSEDDWCINHAVRNVGLRHLRSDQSFRYNPKRVGVWDGDGFILIEDDKRTFHGPWWRFLKWIWDYGFSPPRLHRESERCMHKLHDIGRWLSSMMSLRRLVQSEGLDETAHKSAAQYFFEKGAYDEAFIQDVVRPAVRHRFGLGLEQVSGLSALTAMQAAPLLNIVGGNRRLIHRLLLLSEADLRTETGVTRISPGQRRRWKVESIGTSDRRPIHSSNGSEEYDIVILTAPFQSSGVEIIPNPSIRQSSGLTPYVERHITQFASRDRLSPGAFCQEPNSTLPEDILTSPKLSIRDNQDIFSITTPKRLLPADPGDVLDFTDFLYRIESSRSITNAEIGHLLGHSEVPGSIPSLKDIGVTWLHRKKWPQAHPEFTPKQRLLGNLEIAPKLYYTAAVHELMSSMEMSCVAGRNAIQAIWFDY